MTAGKVVKGIQFINFKNAGDPVVLANKYDTEGADELVFLDITATVENRNILIDVVEKTARQVTIPFSVGGGIRAAADMRLLLKSGADKVSINTGAFKNPKLISNCANAFGNQCVVLSMDVRKTGSQKWNVFINGGNIDTGVSALVWAKQAVIQGAGEILLTSIDNDGTKTGFDVDLTRIISSRVSVPVIASGGAGKLTDFVDILIRGKADAALAASVFHFGEFTIAKVKNYLKKNGIPIRI